jgi:Ribbon-helix-helix protein, copG family
VIEWMTIPEAAREVDRSPRYLLALISDGRVRVKKWRGGRPLRMRWLVDVDSVRGALLPRGRHITGCECARCVPPQTVRGSRFKMDPEMHQAVQREARRLNTSMAEIVRTAIELYLDMEAHR